MKLRKDWVTGIWIFMVMAFLRANVSAYTMDEYFPLHQGDEWTYSSTLNNGTPFETKVVVKGTKLVNGIETINIEGISPPLPNGCTCFVMDSEGLKLYKWCRPELGKTYVWDIDGPSTFFPAIFNLGDVYQESYSYSVYSFDEETLLYTTNERSTISLESVEDVTVSARLFKDCLKIHFFIAWQTSSGESGELEDTHWYARNVGRVKLESNVIVHNPKIGDYEVAFTNELTDYDVNPPTVCPITFALGSDSKDLKTLRKFRNEVLSKTPIGQEIISLYYEWSPVIVKAMGEDETFKEEVKGMIDGVLEMIGEELE